MLLLPNVGTPRVNYSETSYNQNESTDLEKLLNDSLGQYASPDIKIYDSIKNQNLKYVSTILILKDNYFGDENGYSKLKEVATNLIYSKFPKESFTGELEFFYKTPGHSESRTTTIGTYIIPKDRQ